MKQTNLQTASVLELLTIIMHNTIHSAIIYTRELGISMPQLIALMTLHKKGPCHITEIGKELGVSTAAASQLVGRMLEDELISRTEDPNDRRVKLVKLTGKGRQMIQQNFYAHRDHLADLIKTLPEDELVLVHKALQILTTKLYPEVNSPNAEVRVHTQP